MDTPENKPDSVSNSNSPPSGFPSDAPNANKGEESPSTSAGDSGPRPKAAGGGDLGLGKGEPINPPDPAKGEKSASVGQQEFDSNGADKRGDLGKTA